MTYSKTSREKYVVCYLLLSLILVLVGLRRIQHEKRMKYREEQMLRIYEHRNRVQSAWDIMDVLYDYMAKHDGRLPGTVGADSQSQWCDAVKSHISSYNPVVNSDPCTLQIAHKYSYKFLFDTKYSGRVLNGDDLNKKVYLVRSVEDSTVVITLSDLDPDLMPTFTRAKAAGR